MKKQFLSRFDAHVIRKAMILLAIAVLLITISLLVGVSDNIPMIIVQFTGIVLFFYALLSPWGKVKYYAFLSVIFVVIFIFLLFAGIDILVKMESAGKLWVHGAEDIAMPFGFVCVAGFLAGMIGVITRSWIHFSQNAYVSS
jgi:hypothetical protein